MELPTVCIVNPAAKSGFTRINESDFDPDRHVIYGSEPNAGNPPPALAIGIPDDWQSLHWKQRVALAEKLNGDAVLTPADGETQGEAADAVIAAEVARRAGNGA